MQLKTLKTYKTAAAAFLLLDNFHILLLTVFTLFISLAESAVALVKTVDSTVKKKLSNDCQELLPDKVKYHESETTNVLKTFSQGFAEKYCYLRIFLKLLQ